MRDLITICTERRLCLFGTVANGELAPSPAGVVIDSWWHYLPARLPSVELGTVIVMPNQFHAVVHLGTDPERETGPSLGDVVGWFKKRTTWDYSIGVRTEGCQGFRAGFGKGNITIASSATSGVWRELVNMFSATPRDGRTTGITNRER